MRTMYRVDEEMAIGCEGKETEYCEGKNYVNTIEEAQEIANAIVVEGRATGNYRIVKRTMNEDTFTTVDEIVKKFNYWYDYKRYIVAEKHIAEYTKEIERIENSKKNCKTENGIAKKNKEIEWYKREIENAKNIINKR